MEFVTLGNIEYDTIEQPPSNDHHHLRQTIHQNHQEWIDACREATEAINETRTESWKNLRHDASPTPTVQTCGKLFKVLTVRLVLTLLTKLCPTTVEQSLILNLKLTSSLTNYARVSKLSMLQSNRDTNQQFKKRLKGPSVDDESCAPLLMGELQSAIKKMKGKGAAGTDNILSSFLKSLGSLALQDLFSIFNSSFSLAHCQRIWRVATILPLLKAGKSPSEVTSFRPISRTSLTTYTKLLKPRTCSFDSKPVFVKDGAVKIRLLK